MLLPSPVIALQPAAAPLAAFTIKKTTDSASPAFFRNCVAGAHYTVVTLGSQ